MSINWVMLDTSMKDFIRLPREKVLHTSPPRTAIALQSPNSFPGKEPLNIKCNYGRAIITNQRILYLPTKPIPQFQSFQSPILSLQDTHVTAPWFGPNVWEGVLVPTPGGGIQPHHTFVQLKLTFQEGGAYDFSSIYERLKEAASQAAEVARETGRNIQEDGIDLLEQLPAYEETASTGVVVPQPISPSPAVTVDSSAAGIQRPTPINPNGSFRHAPLAHDENNTRPEPSSAERGTIPPPDGPPPGYDEFPQSSIANSLENRVKDSN